MTIIAGRLDETILLGPTSAAFERTHRNHDVLYITSNGGIANPPSSGIVGGRLSSIDISKF